MSVSSVTFTISNGNDGKIKVLFDGASKKNTYPNPESERLSPCPSLTSLNNTKDTEALEAGKRRRVPSVSTESFVTSDSLFDNDELILRTSTPLPQCDDTDSLSDVSFTSCVSQVSELSIVTSSSQETVTSAPRFREKNNNDFYPEHINKERKKSVSYAEQNKNRYGGWMEGDWRSVMKKPADIKSPSSALYKTPGSYRSPSSAVITSSHGSATSSQSKSRIPSLANRPTYNSPPSRQYLSNRVNSATVSYASAASHMPKPYSPTSDLSKSSHASTAPPIKLTLTTDANGNMKLHFSNQASEESWSIVGAMGDSEKVEVHKTA